MNMRPTLLTLTATAVLAAFSAHAHDPSMHDDSPRAPARITPTTCVQFADTARYWADPTHASTKALKARCDAAAKKAVRKRVSKPKP